MTKEKLEQKAKVYADEFNNVRKLNPDMEYNNCMTIFSLSVIAELHVNMEEINEKLTQVIDYISKPAYIVNNE